MTAARALVRLWYANTPNLADWSPAGPHIGCADGPVHRDAGVRQLSEQRLRRYAIHKGRAQFPRQAPRVVRRSIFKPPGRCGATAAPVRSPCTQKSDTTNSTGIPSVHSACGQIASIKSLRVLAPGTNISYAHRNTGIGTGAARDTALARTNRLRMALTNRTC